MKEEWRAFAVLEASRFGNYIDTYGDPTDDEADKACKVILEEIVAEQEARVVTLCVFIEP